MTVTHLHNPCLIPTYHPTLISLLRILVSASSLRASLASEGPQAPEDGRKEDAGSDKETRIRENRGLRDRNDHKLANKSLGITRLTVS